MKYTCSSCEYSTNDKSNFNRHLKRKRKCLPKTTSLDQKVPENDQEEIHRDTQNPVFTKKKDEKDQEEIHRDTQNLVLSEKEIHKDTQNLVFTQENQNRKWNCHYCSKTFSTNCSMNRHMRLYCKVKQNQSQRISELEEQNRQLQSQLQNQNQNQNSGGSNHHNHTNSHNTTNNIINNNNQFNITLPEGTWSRNLWAVMIHLISKTKGDRFTKGELEFNEAFGKTLSVAFHHPDSPLYNTIQMLGRKEAWAKHNGKVVQKKKLLKKINKQHVDRLIQFMFEDNERFRKEMPPVPVIEQWIEVNNEVIRHIKKYDPCDKETIRESEEVFRNQSLINEFNTLVSEVKKNQSMDTTIAHGQEREKRRVVWKSSLKK